jgi:hypothetical protein
LEINSGRCEWWSRLLNIPVGARYCRISSRTNFSGDEMKWIERSERTSGSFEFIFEESALIMSGTIDIPSFICQHFHKIWSSEKCPREGHQFHITIIDNPFQSRRSFQSCTHRMFESFSFQCHLADLPWTYSIISFHEWHFFNLWSNCCDYPVSQPFHHFHSRSKLLIRDCAHWDFEQVEGLA